MKFIVSILLTALLSFATGLFTILPWWSFAICAFVVAIAVHQKPWKAFLSGFIALALLWGTTAAYIDARNDHLLAGKVAILLIKTNSAITLVLITALIAGLVGGLAALTGSFLRKK